MSKRRLLQRFEVPVWRTQSISLISENIPRFEVSFTIIYAAARQITILLARAITLSFICRLKDRIFLANLFAQITTT